LKKKKKNEFMAVTEIEKTLHEGGKGKDQRLKRMGERSRTL